MEFETDRLFHIYNRGNNSQTIFFTRDNYLFFLEKMKNYLLPFGNLLAWCLIPNHFHLMMEVTNVSITFTRIRHGLLPGSQYSQGLTPFQPSQGLTQHFNPDYSRLPPSIPDSTDREISLNESIGIMLRSYTRAIQNQEQFTGSLFQKSTKAICLNDPKLEPAYFNTAFGTVINRSIHRNPLHHHLVTKLSDWEFSSFPDFYCQRNGMLVNRERARELGLLDEDSSVRS
jgi:putative transposase